MRFGSHSRFNSDSCFMNGLNLRGSMRQSQAIKGECDDASGCRDDLGGGACASASDTAPFILS